MLHRPTCMQFPQQTHVAGYLPNATTAVGVMGLSTQISIVPYMVSYSFGAAAATRVANSLGAGQPHAAKTIFRQVAYSTGINTVC